VILLFAVVFLEPSSAEACPSHDVANEDKDDDDETVLPSVNLSGEDDDENAAARLTSESA